MTEELNTRQLEDAFEKVFTEKSKDFEKLKQTKLIISLLGSVNTGKSTTINALTGIDYAVVKAVSGSTKEVSLYPLRDNVFIADTPGLHDINQEVSKRATDFVEKDTDLLLFFLNAAAGLTMYDKEALLSVRQMAKHVIVILNKIDTLDDEELKDVVQQIETETEYTPIAISAKKGTNMKELHRTILSFLEKDGKELLFLKVSNRKEEEVSTWINRATVAATGIGAIPIPGSDIIPLTSLQVGLALKIAYIWNCTVTKNDVMQLVGASITGGFGKQIYRWTVTALKAVGWIPGGQVIGAAMSAIAAGVAGSLTYSFGWACNLYYKGGKTMDLGAFGEVFSTYYTEHKNKPGSQVE